MGLYCTGIIPANVRFSTKGTATNALVLLACLWWVPLTLPAWSQEATEIPLQPRKVKVVALAVTGADRPEEVLLAIETKPGDRIVRAQIQRDLQRVYGLGIFSDVTASEEPLADGIRLTIHCLQNPTLSEVRVNAIRVFEPAQIQALFADQMNKPLNYQQLDETKDKIEALYKEKGYTLGLVVSATLSVEGVLQLAISEGVIEDIRINGLQETHEHVVRRELTLKKGDLFNVKHMRDDLRRVFNTNFFDDVGLRFELGKDPEHYVVVVDVKEKQTGSVNLGAGYNSRDGAVGVISVSKDNLFGNGQRVSADLQIGTQSLLYKADWFDPWLLPERTSMGASLYRQRLSALFTNFTDDRTGASVTVGRPFFGDPLTTPWRAVATLKAERITTMDKNGQVAPDLSVSQTGTDFLVSGSVGITYDSRDIPLDPRDGWFGQASVTPVLGQATYLKLNGALSRYWAPSDWLVLALGGRMGWMGGIIPPYDQIFGGGSELIRGWPEDGSLRGDRNAIVSVEARFPLFKPLGGVVFYDVGAFWRQNEDVLRQVKQGVGAGFRINSPLGAIRVDYGLRRFSPLEGALHFNIGQKF